MRNEIEVRKRIQEIESIIKRATPTYANKLRLKLEELYWVLDDGLMPTMVEMVV